jgi:hypothetical protein
MSEWNIGWKKGVNAEKMDADWTLSIISRDL